MSDVPKHRWDCPCDKDAANAALRAEVERLTKSHDACHELAKQAAEKCGIDVNGLTYVGMLDYMVERNAALRKALEEIRMEVAAAPLTIVRSIADKALKGGGE